MRYHSYIRKNCIRIFYFFVNFVICHPLFFVRRGRGGREVPPRQCQARHRRKEYVVLFSPLQPKKNSLQMMYKRKATRKSHQHQEGLWSGQTSENKQESSLEARHSCEALPRHSRYTGVPRAQMPDHSPVSQQDIHNNMWKFHANHINANGKTGMKCKNIFRIILYPNQTTFRESGPHWSTSFSLQKEANIFCSIHLLKMLSM